MKLKKDIKKTIKLEKSTQSDLFVVNPVQQQANFVPLCQRSSGKSPVYSHDIVVCKLFSIFVNSTD